MDKVKMLKELGLKTMFYVTDEDMPELIDEYDIFMNHVAVLEKINTEGIEPLVYPYEIETTFLREDKVDEILSQDDVLKNAKDVLDHQIKVPKVVG